MTTERREPAEPATATTRDETEEQGRRLLHAHEASWALWAVLRTADEAQHAMARTLGLPTTDALAMEHILTSPEPLGPGEVGRRLGISTASATVLVDRLVASGHLIRRPDPRDGRRRILEATERARDDAVRAMTPLLGAVDAVAARLDEDTATAVVTYLREVAEIHRSYSRSPQGD